LLKIRSKKMARTNNTSITNLKKVENSTQETGPITTNIVGGDSDNNTSINNSEEVIGANLKTGPIDETLPSIDLKELIAELKEELKPLLNEIAGNPRNKKPRVAVEIIHAEIDENPTLKQRLIGALKAGGIEALKAIFDNSAFSIPVEAVKGFLEPS
jgi:internalin A